MFSYSSTSATRYSTCTSTTTVASTAVRQSEKIDTKAPPELGRALEGWFKNCCHPRTTRSSTECAGPVKKIVISENLSSGILAVSTIDVKNSGAATSASKSEFITTARSGKSGQVVGQGDSKSAMSERGTASGKIPHLPDETVTLVAAMSDFHTLLNFSFASRNFCRIARNLLEDGESPQNLDLLKYRIRNIARRMSDLALRIDTLEPLPASDGGWLSDSNGTQKYSILFEDASLHSFAKLHAVRCAGSPFHSERLDSHLGRRLMLAAKLRFLIDLESEFGFLQYGAVDVHLDEFRKILENLRQHDTGSRDVQPGKSNEKIQSLAIDGLAILSDKGQLIYDSHRFVLEQITPLIHKEMEKLPQELRNFDATNSDHLVEVLKFCGDFFKELERACKPVKPYTSEQMQQMVRAGDEANKILFMVGSELAKLNGRDSKAVDVEMDSAGVPFFEAFNLQPLPAPDSSIDQFVARHYTDKPARRPLLLIELLAEQLNSRENRLAKKAVLVRELLLAVNEARMSTVSSSSGKEFNVPYRIPAQGERQIAHSLIWPQSREDDKAASTTKPWFKNGQRTTALFGSRSPLPDVLLEDKRFSDWEKASRESKRMAECLSTPSECLSTPSSSSSSSCSLAGSPSVSSSSSASPSSLALSGALFGSYDAGSFTETRLAPVSSSSDGFSVPTASSTTSRVLRFA